MSSILDSLRARVDGLSEATQRAVAMRREEEAKARAAEKMGRAREKTRRENLAAACGSEDNEDDFEQIVHELAELMKMKREIEFNIRRANGDDELGSELNSTLADIETGIEGCLERGDRDFLQLLAELELAAPTLGAELHFALLAVGRGLFGEIGEVDATLRLNRISEARGNGELLPPEQARYIFRIPDRRDNTIRNFIQAWCESTETTKIAQIKAFSAKFGEFIRSVKRVHHANREEIENLDSNVNLIVADLFSKNVEGVVKLTGLTKEDPWIYLRPDGEEGRVYGPVYLELDHGRAAVVLPESSRLRKTCEILGLLHSDGEGRKFRFSENFENIDLTVPWQKFGQIRAFLCKAAGLKQDY